jgi:hypothetical protein
MMFCVLEGLPASARAASQPAPSEEQLSLARDKWARRLALVDRRLSIRQRRVLAQRLRELAAEDDNTPAEKYLLLKTSAEQAAASGEVDTFIEAIDTLEEQFEGDWLAWRVELLKQIARPIRSSRLFMEAVEECFRVIDQAREQRRAELGEPLLDAMERWARVRRLRTLQQRVEQKRQTLAAANRRETAYRQALKTLEKADDPDAHLTVGRHVLFTEHDWERALPHLARSSDETLRRLAELEENRSLRFEDQVALADGWYELAGQHDGERAELFAQRAMHWFEQASKGANRQQQALLNRQLAPLVLAEAQKRINALSQWHIGKGQWTQTDDGRIVGKGDSSLRFRDTLPTHCVIEFRMTVLKGMRPRVFFGGGMYIGNEGFTKQVKPHGTKSYQGGEWPYQHGQIIHIAVDLKGQDFRWSANGRLMGKGKCRKVPAAISLRLSGGDGWSKGTTAFWDFRLRPRPAQ